MYCEKSDIEDVFGITNVAKWADLDGEGDSEAIEGRIDKACAVASSYVDSALRDSVYALPLADAEDEIPLEIVDVAANLAGVWLYENRGTQDVNNETGKGEHRLSFNRKRAEQTLREIRRGQRTITAVFKTGVTTVPKAT